MTDMELGNMLSGHSRGAYPIEDMTAFSGIFSILLYEAGLDDYGHPDGDGPHVSENDTFEIHPYCWCDREGCPQCDTGEQPNFLYKPTGFEIQWYKYPMRDAYMNQRVSRREFMDIVNKCVESLHN